VAAAEALREINGRLSKNRGPLLHPTDQGNDPVKVSNIKEKIWERTAVCVLWVAATLGAFSSTGSAQANQGGPAPDTTSLLFLGEQPAQPQGAVANSQSLSGSIAGSITDTNGAVVPGAKVQLMGPDGTLERTVTADLWGSFLFSKLPAGTFRITVSAPNLATVTSNPIVLTAGQNLQLPATVLRVGQTHADVQVVATLHDVAQAQVQAQEKQRVLGIVPNFYSSYIWNAAPMSPKQKFGLALRDSIDPVTFVVAAGTAGVEQWHNTFPGYGTGAEGYLKRFGAAYADYAIYTMIADAALPSAFKQDPRYFYMGSGSTKSRAWYAVSRTFVTRSDSGRSEVNWSHLLGGFVAAGISNVYRAPQDRTASLTVRNAAIIIGGSAATNLIREFVLRKLTPKVPDAAQGKP
jgi:hypothetical protein